MRWTDFDDFGHEDDYAVFVEDGELVCQQPVANGEDLEWRFPSLENDLGL